MGVVAFDADTAERWVKDDGKAVIMMRPETKPDDVHGMLAAEGIVTSRGGRTSHAALVARQFGKPAVVGVEDLEIDLNDREARVGDLLIREGTEVSIDGARGEVYLGALPKVVPDIEDAWLGRLMEWADEFRTLEVWANSDYPEDARRARRLGAQGIGLCRTEHMFFEEDRLPIMREMIMARTDVERQDALDRLLPLQRGDFAGLFKAMDGLPVVVRLLDPPLHEFLPNHQELLRELSELKLRLQHLDTLREIDVTLEEIRAKQDFLHRTEELLETNPMLGTRGVRLAMLLPELTRMQTRALFQAAAACMREGVDVKVEVMIPLVSHVNELHHAAQPGRCRGPTGHGRGGAGDPVQARHDDRDPASRADGRRARRGGRVLLVRHERPHPDGVRHLAGRRRVGLPDALPGTGRAHRQPLRHARPGRSRPHHAPGRPARTRRAARPSRSGSAGSTAAIRGRWISAIGSG